MKDHWGKSYLAPDINHIQHTARGLLQDFRDKGMPVPMDDPPWMPETIDQCAEQGPHPIMHAIDQVFAQQDSDTAQWKEAISEKKLDKGDGGWSQ